jgi:hypothetical protein
MAQMQLEAEMDLGGVNMGGMSREMFLMKSLDWELLPPDLEGVDGKLRRHVLKYFKDPVKLQLQRKVGKFGCIAIGQTAAGQKLRAYWRQQPPGSKTNLKTSEFLEASYDKAVQSRLNMIEFEVQLPPMKKSKKLPSVVYSVAVEGGSMNHKSVIARGAGRVKIYPQGRGSEPVDAGIGNIGLSIRPGLVDPGWAKGRKIFRKGRPTGTI